MNCQFLRAIAQQAHLCPVSQEVQPVIWGLDHMLQLHAPPNAVRHRAKFSSAELVLR